MVRTHYTSTELIEALREVGLKKGDTLFSHSHIGFFGRPEGRDSQEDVCALILESIQTVIGDSGTLIVPTFTYSFPARQIYDLDESPSDCGIFAEYVRLHRDSIRSSDPCISVAAIGNDAEHLTELAPTNAYGDGSLFQKFYECGGKVCNLNFDAGSTFVHYVERQLNVPYRYDKTFEGTVRSGGLESAAKSTIWVRYASSAQTIAEFEPFDLLARQRDLFRTARVGRGQVGLISAVDTFELISETLLTRPWLLTLAEKTGIEPILDMQME